MNNTVTTKNRLNRTPLDYACIYCRTNIVQYLLSTGKVDPLAKNDEGSDVLCCWQQEEL